MGSKDKSSWDDEITTDGYRRVQNGKMLGNSNFLVRRKVCPVPHQPPNEKQAGLMLS